MRKQIYVDRRSRGVWREAEEAAKADDLSLSGFVAIAVADYLKRRKLRLSREATHDPAV